MNELELKACWRQQPTEVLLMSEVQLHARAQRFERTIRIRNALEYLAGVFVVVTFAWYMVLYDGLLMRTGCLLIILGTAFVMTQLGRRASASRPAPQALGLAGLAYHRSALERQRDALRSVWAWYLLPMLPGLVVFMWGGAVELPTATPAGLAKTGLLIAVLFVAIAWANRAAAKRLQREIDQLDRLAS